MKASAGSSLRPSPHPASFVRPHAWDLRSPERRFPDSSSPHALQATWVERDDQQRVWDETRRRRPVLTTP